MALRYPIAPRSSATTAQGRGCLLLLAWELRAGRSTALSVGCHPHPKPSHSPSAYPNRPSRHCREPQRSQRWLHLSSVLMPRAVGNLPGHQPKAGSLLQGSAPSRGPSLLSSAQGAQHHLDCAWHWGGSQRHRVGRQRQEQNHQGCAEKQPLLLSHRRWRVSSTAALEGTLLK